MEVFHGAPLADADDTAIVTRIATAQHYRHAYL